MCTRGMVERCAPRCACAGEMHGTQTEQLHAEKAEEVQKQPAYKRPEAEIWRTCEPDISGASKAFSRPNTKETGVTGLSRAAGRRREGRYVPTGK